MISISKYGLQTDIYQELFPQDLQNLILLLHEEFEPLRAALLSQRRERQKGYDLGVKPKFEYTHIAKLISWKVAPIPADLADRRVEITGPINNTKMVINMLNENATGQRANTAMLDFEDSMVPTWKNVTSGLQNIIAVAKKNLEFHQEAENNEPSKVYRLNPEKMAHPMVRIRGLHLNENHVKVRGQSVSAGLFDLVCTAYHTACDFMTDGKTPKFYVPKCEHYLEARYWENLFSALEQYLKIPHSSIKVTFLIETLPASFQMEEILYEIRNRACGLNVGRWDKIFSDIKTLRMHPDRILANRSFIDMSKPWMENYAKLLIRTCHSHGAYAIGGMAAFTPGQDEVTQIKQVEKVKSDKLFESRLGHDGCWVSHPFFIVPARSQFTKPNQLDVMPTFDSEPDLLPQSVGPKTLEGLRQNVRVGIAYQEGWLRGLGCVAFENMMEDLATLEISRAQTWQWLHHHVHLDDGTVVTKELVSKLFDEECERIFRDQNITSEEQKKSYQNAKYRIRKVFLMDQLADFFPLIEQGVSHDNTSDSPISLEPKSPLAEHQARL